MKENVVYNYIIRLDLKLLYKKELNILFIKEKYGVLFLYLPRFFFISENINNLKLSFLSKLNFMNVLKQFLFLCNYYLVLFFFRIKLKGLGYRIRKITKKIYRFFLAYNHYFYFFVPKNVFIWTKKRYLIAVSIDKMKLNNVFSNLVLLKKLDFFERTNSFIVPNKVLFLKK